MTTWTQIGLLVVALLGVTHITIANFDVKFEKIEQINGTEYMDFRRIRVRKFNRTVSVLDGTFDLLMDADDRFLVAVKLAYSSRGNNQFNQYPMKIAPQKICEFFNTTWRDYHQYFKDDTNFPEIGECPITAKELYVKNHVLDSKMFTKYLPHGLWRMSLLMQTTDTGAVLLVVEVLFKVADRGIFQ
ncbi:uncharacterized protein LOC129718542 [Wyeomyia smithii]|uniref:uncharacterized protein LOC129718542 n=1 Tax=Wyeomyia smithii TaxID=174621 RepID=UPI002467DC50|nr:uncharacterized protein LOC129718542 [Wyeomyia smithii]